MPTPYTDGNYDTYQLTGVPTVSFPLQEDGEYYAHTVQQQITALSNTVPVASPVVERYTHENLLLYTDDLTNAAWQTGTISGTGVTPVVTAGFTGPDGGDAWRVQCDRGAGDTSADYSRISQSLTGQTDPRTSATGAWIKSYDGTSQNVHMYSGDGQGERLVAVNSAWRFYGNIVAVSGSTTELFAIGTRGGTGSDQTVDLLIAKPQYEASSTIGPFVSTNSTSQNVSSPTVHPTYPLAYLVEQADPSTQSGALQSGRTYASIPASTNVGTSIAVVLPDAPVVAPNTWGSYIVIQPDISVEKYDIYDKTDVITDSGAVTQFNVTGGTYTVTLGSDTTGSLNYNDNAATVNAAVNGLTYASARNNVEVTGSYTDGFSIQFNNLYEMTGDNTHLANGTVTVSSVGGSFGRQQTVVVGPASNVVPTGTFTLSFNGGTTANISYTANGATVLSSLNAVSEIQNAGNAATVGVSINGSIYTYTVNFNNNQNVTVDTSSLVPASSYSVIEISEAYNTTQNFNLVGDDAKRSLYAPDHGITGGDNIVVKTGSSSFLFPDTFTVTGDDTIDLKGGPTAAWMTTAAINQIGPRSIQNYTPGPITAVARIQSDYYLPGVTSGITTFEDIPVPDEESTDTEILEKVFSGTGNLTYRVDSLERWNGWPIYKQSQTIINVADII